MNKKIWMIALLVVLFGVFYINASEKTIIIEDEDELIKVENELIKIEKKAKEKTSALVEEKETKVVTETKTESISVIEKKLARSNKLIKMGKTLTVLGIVGIADGALTLGLATVTGVFALHFSGALSGIAAAGWQAFSWSAFMASASSSVLVASLTAATLFLGIVGIVALGMGILLIPGIVTWSIGAAKHTKYKNKVTLLHDKIGFAVRL